MQKWEYLTLIVGHGNGKVDSIDANGSRILSKAKVSELYEYLNKIGLNGWEMVSVRFSDPTEYYYFKRPKA
jgi:hypothetical protein